jgi:hypothetical protein
MLASSWVRYLQRVSPEANFGVKLNWSHLRVLLSVLSVTGSLSQRSFQPEAQPEVDSGFFIPQ